MFTATPLSISLAAALAYLIGGMPFGYWFVRFAFGDDIRGMGSGNIGATNVHRIKGGKAGVIVLLLDVLKGFLAVFLASQITGGDALGIACATFAVMLGHCFPVFLRFKGGKAVACYVGAFLYLAPMVLLAVAVLFVLLVSLTKYISLASIISAIAFPFALMAIHPALPILIACAASSALVIWRHRANIERLRAGRENVFTLKGGKTA